MRFGDLEEQVAAAPPKSSSTCTLCSSIEIIELIPASVRQMKNMTASTLPPDIEAYSSGILEEEEEEDEQEKMGRKRRRRKRRRRRRRRRRHNTDLREAY